LLIDQSFKNENKVNANETCEIFMFDVLEEGFEENLIVQTKQIEIQKVKMNKN
jgi:hypothetical protein